MQPDSENPNTVKCADLLYPGFGEIIGEVKGYTI